jgi:asparagine N-glycosylation enzyme membrane subunit Stt3
MADRPAPTPAEIVIMVAGAVMIVFSFLDFVAGASSWGTGSFPIVTLLPVYGLLMAVHIALTKFAGVNLPESIAGFTWEQLHLAVGAMAALMAIAWLITDIGDKKIGAWFEILGGIALLVGAVLLQRERQTGAIG